MAAYLTTAFVVGAVGAWHLLKDRANPHARTRASLCNSPRTPSTAAPERSQAFMLIGVAITLPLIIGYTAWAYWVFRGKVGDEGYH
jgi:cytochrome bd-type quinol oxidase subunit 1